MVVAVGIVSVLGLLGVFIAYHRFTDPERIRVAAEEYLQRWTSGQVHVESASFSLMGGIRLNDVSVLESIRNGVPAGRATLSSPVFSCHEILIEHDPWGLLRGRLNIESLVATRPTCTLVHDAATGWSSFVELLPHLDPQAAVSLTPPPIELRNARLRLIHHTDEGDKDVEDLKLTVRGRQSPRDPRLFDLVWQNDSSPSTGGHSQIDLATGYLRNVQGGLPTMSVGAVMLAIDAGYEGADALGDLLGLQGRVRALDYNLIGPPLNDAQRSATIELRDTSLSIPISAEEHDLSGEERYLRFEGVNGEFTITADTIQAKFRGLFHGSECHVSATIRGDLAQVATLDDVDVHAVLSTTGLELPRWDSVAPADQRRFVKRWESLTHFFEDYNPHGPIDVELDIAKASGADAPIIVRRASLSARGGDASCRYFPYRGDQLTGTVEFTPDGVFVRDICGMHDSAKVCVNVWMEAPTKVAAARVDIAASDVPLDDTLFAGMQPEYRALLSPFAPRGMVNAVVRMVRPTSTNDDMAPWDIATRVSFDDISAEYDRFPVPIDHLSGEVALERGQIVVQDLVGHIGEGQVRIHGIADLEEAQVAAFEFQVDASDVEMDDQLWSALPSDLRERIAPFDPQGCIDTQTSLALDPDTESVRQESAIKLNDVTLTYDRFPLRVTDVNGRLRLNNDRMEVEDVRGRHGESEISASGTLGLEGSGSPVELEIRARKLMLDDAFREASPMDLRHALESWRVDDPISADVSIVSDADHPDALRWNVLARLTGATVHHERLPLPFTDVRASISLDESGLAAKGVSARYGRAAVRLDIQSQDDSGDERGVIRLHVAGASLDQGIRGALPEYSHSLWDKLGPSGRVDMNIDELRYWKTKNDPETQWSVKGQLDLRDVTLSGGAEAASLNGVVSLDGMLVDRLGGMNILGRFGDAEAVLYGRGITSAQGKMSYARAASGEGCLTLRQMTGRFYDGDLSADAEWVFDALQSSYKISATTQGMQLGPFVNARVAPTGGTQLRQETGEKLDLRGRVDAHLYLSGEWDAPQSRRGGGRVEIVDGYIYKLPILLAILNVLNIAVPNDGVIDEAHAGFYVMGNTVTFGDILLRGDSLILVGNGTMSIPDRGVDLTLVNQGAGRLAGIPVVAELIEGATRELVELRVTGPLSHPNVRASPLHAITDELKQLFQKRKPKKIVEGGA